MNTNIRKSEFSGVLKIGKYDEFKGHTFTKDDFYCNDCNGEKVLHLNKLAWESPSIWTDKNGKEHYGFVPGDPLYDEIIEAFKKFPDVYRNKFNGGTIVRKHWVGSDNYDILITWYSEPKMISWYFCKSYEYAV